MMTASSVNNPETTVFCEVSEPIRWSEKDTPETIAQAKAHNAVGARLNCKKINTRWMPNDK